MTKFYSNCPANTIIVVKLYIFTQRKLKSKMQIHIPTRMIEVILPTSIYFGAYTCYFLNKTILTSLSYSLIRIPISGKFPTKKRVEYCIIICKSLMWIDSDNRIDLLKRASQTKQMVINY